MFLFYKNIHLTMKISNFAKIFSVNKIYFLEHVQCFELTLKTALNKVPGWKNLLIDGNFENEKTISKMTEEWEDSAHSS